MPINSRNKGSNAERELAARIHEHLGIRLIRNLEQSRAGGHDLVLAEGETGPVAAALARYAIEAKRHARATPALLAGWWKQAQGQAAEAGLIPALAYRADRAPWRVVLPLSELRPDLPPWPGVEFTADLSLPAWCALVREGFSND